MPTDDQYNSADFMSEAQIDAQKLVECIELIEDQCRAQRANLPSASISEVIVQAKKLQSILDSYRSVSKYNKRDFLLKELKVKLEKQFDPEIKAELEKAILKIAHLKSKSTIEK